VFNPEDRVGVIQTHNKDGETCGEIITFSVLDEEVKETLRISSNWSMVLREVLEEIEVKVAELNERGRTAPNWQDVADFRDGIVWVKSRLSKIQ
jgi:hypothetical protein